MNRMRVLGLAVLLCVVAVACGGDTSTGDGLEVDPNAQGGGAANRVDATTTTRAPATTTTAAGKQNTTTTAKAATTTTQPAAALTIKINPDSADAKFEPAIGAVRAGHTVEWVNNDSQPRSVEADGGVFASPPIAPGAKWAWKANARGTINYKDGTRPYAVAQLRVQ